MTHANDLRAKRPPNRANVERHKEEMRLEMTLAAVREAADLSQALIAQRLGTSRPNVSRIEQETDILVSTLRRYVEAAGGRLETKVVFPDGRELQLTR